MALGSAIAQHASRRRTLSGFLPCPSWRFRGGRGATGAVAAGEAPSRHYVLLRSNSVASEHGGSPSTVGIDAACENAWEPFGRKAADSNSCRQSRARFDSRPAQPPHTHHPTHTPTSPTLRFQKKARLALPIGSLRLASNPRSIVKAMLIKSTDCAPQAL